MRPETFDKLPNNKRKDRLKTIITQKTHGMISDDVMEKIIKSIDLDVQYKIKVVREAERMLEILILEDDYWDNDWTFFDSEGNKEKGKLIVGKCEFGVEYSHKHNYNGQEVSCEIYKEEPTFFDPNALLIIEIDKKEWRDVAGERNNYNTEEKKIVIYIPQ